ncbi:MAG: hypothetical protein HN392_13750 [Anaerolineae bacterium]|jgi:hypothetical protein|nr:hypothetical protein [Anaerolineae bacterium]MBT7073288.1 hypothetical protein [Anaerolineae bacterium]
MKYSIYNKEKTSTVKGIMINKRYTRVAFIAIGAACSGPDYPQAPAAPIVIEAPSVDISVPAPSRQEPSPTPEVTPVATQEQPTQDGDTQHCDLFNNMDITVVYMDWKRNEPLEFYFKIPGGVPGLSKTIPDTTNTWEYSGKIGDHTTSSCNVISGYAERLYCKVNLPSEYEYTARQLSLSLNGCEQPIYTDPATTIPGFIN